MVKVKAFNFDAQNKKIDNLSSKLDSIHNAQAKLQKKANRTVDDENKLVAKEFDTQNKLFQITDEYTTNYSLKYNNVPAALQQIYKTMNNSRNWILGHLDKALAEVRIELIQAGAEKTYSRLQEYQLLQVQFYLLNRKAKIKNTPELQREIRFTLECINALRGSLPASQLASDEVYDSDCEACFQKWLNGQKDKLVAGTNPIVQKYLTQFGINIKGK